VRYVVGEFCSDPESYADRLFVSEDTFAIADGMGTLRGGKLAAEKAISLVGENRPFRSSEELRTFFEKANREVMSEVARLGDAQTAGTTLSVLSLTGERFFVGHVGDSRIYLLRSGELELLTKDQVTYRGGRKHITVLGVEWKPEIHTCEGELRDGDTFLLISDGAAGALSEEDLRVVLGHDLSEAAKDLLELHERKGGGEDMSFVIVRSV